MTLDNFYKHKTPDGFHTYCIKCNKKSSHQWQIDNREQYRKLHKKQNDRPEMKKLSRDCWAKKRENGDLREWQRNNPDKVKASADKRQHKNHRISNKQWENCKKYFVHRCAYCGLKIEEHYIKFKGQIQLGDFHKEHVDDKGVNDLSNCVPSCKECNSEKHDKEFESWYNEENTKYSTDRYLKIMKWLNSDYLKYM